MGATNSAKTALDLLVLTVLGGRGPLQGYGIANAIEDLSLASKARPQRYGQCSRGTTQGPR